MTRILSGCMIWLLCSNLALPAIAQTRDRRMNDLILEMSKLKSTVADQDQRIAELEKTVKALQASTLPGTIPPATPAWRLAPNWTLIKQGMSRVQVKEILGPPTKESTVLDVDTWYYATDSRSTTTMNGSVRFTGDRVTAMIPPAF
jgi:SmpA/OmlA family protein